MDLTKLKNDDLIEHIRTLAEIRKSSEALQTGIYEEVQVRNETLVFARALPEEYVLVALNNTADEKQLSFDYRGQHFDIVLEPHGSKVLK